MAADNPNYLSDLKGDLILTINGVDKNVGAVSGLLGTFDLSNVTEFNSSNRGTLVSFVDAAYNVSVELYETQQTELMDIIMNGVRTVTPGVLESGRVYAVDGTSYEFGDLIKFDKQNADKSKPANVSVSGSTDGALTDNVDYYIVEVAGQWGVAIQDSATVTTMAQTFTITYDVTPADSESFTTTTGTQQVKTIALRIVSEGGERVLSADSMRFEGTYDLGFTDVIEDGALPTASVTFVSNKGATVTYDTTRV